MSAGFVDLDGWLDSPYGKIVKVSHGIIQFVNTLPKIDIT